MELILHKPDGTTERFPADAHRLGIGRARDNDIVIADPMLSRHHATVYRDDDGAWWVEDLGSRNGTWLNGDPLSEPGRASGGDEIELGGCKIQLLADQSATQPGPELQTGPADEGTIFVSQAPQESMGGQGQLLAEAARALVSADPAKAKLEQLLRLALRSTRAERGLIASVDAEGTLRPMVAVPPLDEEQPPRISRAVRDKVLETGEAVIAGDVTSDDALKASQTLVDAGVRSVVAAPLSGERGRVLGMLYMDTVARRAVFEAQDLEVANVLGGMAGMTLEAESVRLELEAKRRLEADLCAAWDIQQSLLPASNPAAPDGMQVSAHHIPCQAVGGDLYDLFPFGDGFGAMVADVAGKGLPAALLGAELHGRWKGLTEANADLTQWAAHLNAALSGQLPSNRFITLAFAIVDPARDTLRLVGAGQTSIYVSDGQVEVLDPTGPVLGMLPGTSFQILERPFAPGSRLLLFSDGLTDQVSPNGEPFEMERLLATLRSCRDADATDIQRCILEAIDAHAQGADQSDDTTLVVLSRDG